MRRLNTTDYKTALQLLENPSFAEHSLKTRTPQENREQINKDILVDKRESFISPTGDLTLFQNRWLMAADQKNYGFGQADASGSEIPELFYSEVFIKALESDHTYMAAHSEPEQNPRTYRKSFRFGYFNDLGEASGINLNYNSENPQQWILTILQNANAPFDQRRIYTFINGMKFTSSLSSSLSTVEEFLACLGSFSIAQLLEPLIDKDTQAINEQLSTLLLYKTGHVVPSKCPKPKDLIALYRKKIGEQIVERKKTVSIQASEEHNPDVYEVNLDEPFNYDDILKFTQARFRVLIPWLQEQKVINEDRPMPAIPFPQTPICPFAEGNIPNSLSNFLLQNVLHNNVESKNSIALIPLDYGSHWNLLVICINPNNHIISADYFYSYPNEVPKKLGEESILLREIKRADENFTGNIYCFHHFHSNNPNSSGILAIQEMVFYIRYALGLEKKLDPLFFKDDDIATLLAQCKRLIAPAPQLIPKKDSKDEKDPSEDNNRLRFG